MKNIKEYLKAEDIGRNWGQEPIRISFKRVLE
jgi:hypothetical protein